MSVFADISGLVSPQGVKLVVDVVVIVDSDVVMLVVDEFELGELAVVDKFELADKIRLVDELELELVDEFELVEEIALVDELKMAE